MCSAASLLEHWFREEEAVVRGKYKAIPYLIRLPDTQAGADKLCGTSTRRIGQCNGGVCADKTTIIGAVGQSGPDYQCAGSFAPVQLDTSYSRAFQGKSACRNQGTGNNRLETLEFSRPGLIGARFYKRQER